MTQKHTPGPWEYFMGDICADDGNLVIAAMNRSCGARSSSYETLKAKNPAVQANARLIAAAPDMLEALKAAQESIATFMGVHRYPADSGAGAILAEVSAAIAKAEGRE